MFTQLILKVLLIVLIRFVIKKTSLITVENQIELKLPNFVPIRRFPITLSYIIKKLKNAKICKDNYRNEQN